MTSWRASRVAAALLATVGLAALALPALGQKAPESILPSGFGDPLPAPTPAPAPAGAPTPAAPPPADLLPPSVQQAAAADALANATDPLAEEGEANTAIAYDMPPEAQRNPAFVGPLGRADGGFGPNAWGRADGVFLSRLMRGTRAPVASRWASITLRRALLSRTPAPIGVDGADWVAERAWLLLRMGEADPARMLVAGIDSGKYTPKLYEIAMQAALANADPAALCPVVEPGSAYGKTVSWDLTRAMCAALQAEPGPAGAIIDATRRSGRARGIDLLLAEKVVGAGVNGRRAVNIQWDGVNQLTAWRFGLAGATGVAVPEPLIASVGPHVRAWQARLPMLEPAARVGSASWAATLGVFSAAAYADLYGAVLDSGDVGSAPVAVAEALSRAAAADEASARMTALRGLWDEAGDPRERFARLILTARAAAFIAPDRAFEDDAGRLIASMLTAGYDSTAARWGEIASRTGGDAWALLAVGAPSAAVPVTAARVRDYAGTLRGAETAKARFLIAALAGLGRLPAADAEALARDFDVPVGRQDNWTRAIDRAARARQPGTVALLAAVGMQTREWRAVPPAYLYHIVAALNAVGRAPEARMIAAEAITRA
ncbi:hypothetical protein [Sphingomonas flavalba]|uniref:hypothetical protein n=1 Tax=Sphingomonas flavalba TaxID=2559804 RepID=UPI00109DAC36|nr:hypothetical protein [Sphingomonas flavalba]